MFSLKNRNCIETWYVRVFHSKMTNTALALPKHFKVHCDNRIMIHFCEMFFLSESGSQKYEGFFSPFFSVLIAEFQYFSTILKQAEPERDRPKKDHFSEGED